MEWVAWLVFFLGVGMVGVSLHEQRQLRKQKERFAKMLNVHQEQRQLDSVNEIARLRDQWRKLIAETEAEEEILSRMASKFKAAIEQLPDEARMAIMVMPKLPVGLTEPGTAQCPMCGAVVPMPGGIRKEN